jgi:hypothetical protein
VTVYLSRALVVSDEVVNGFRNVDDPIHPELERARNQELDRLSETRVAVIFGIAPDSPMRRPALAYENRERERSG